ncbi:hypothetical protein GBAR_LOCUS4765 [Geodia barretti]|uniref:Uncharacterized protein n=1 Tax=Geodia barretti TaxID=519541 RepID=A0AA35R9F3_GEOBA|nr:hypothetical protein GBAR_LOCUS4765 [Geodia barretti]
MGKSKLKRFPRGPWPSALGLPLPALAPFILRPAWGLNWQKGRNIERLMAAPTFSRLLSMPIML